MLYLCFDTALNKEYTLLLLQKSYPQHRCLFEGTKDARLWDAAPWLFIVPEPPQDRFKEDAAASLQRTILFESELELEALCSYLQEFLYYTEEGKEYYFRFWDAAVMDKFLHTCQPEQLEAFFGATITALYYTEPQDQKTLVRYTLGKKNQLSKTIIAAVAAPPEKEEIQPETTVKKPRRFFLD